MSNNGTIKGNFTNSYGAYWSFEWTATKKSAGVTTVNWNLYTRGRTSSPKWLDTSCKLTVTANNVTKASYNSGNLEATSSEASFNNIFRTSGSFTVQHETDGSANFSVRLEGHIYNHANEIITGIGNLDTNYPYTSCGAPTSVIINSTILAPNKSFTVSWSGATSGTSNAITGYNISYKVGSGSWTTDVFYTTTSGSGSKALTLSSSATRGAYVQVRVKTIGTQSGYNSDYKYSSSSTYKVNTLPTAPTITVDKTKVPYKGEAIITAVAGTTGDTGQTATVYYSTNSTGANLQKYTGAIKVNTTNTYYFWTYDGLEYGTKVSKTIIVNTSKPSINNINVGGTALISENKPDGYDYIISPTITLTKTGGQSSGNKYAYKIKYSSSLTGPFASVTVSSNNSSSSYTIPDVRNYIPITTEQGYYYKISALCYDGIEYSEEVETSTLYYVTKIPVCSSVLNDSYDKNTENNINKLRNYFLNKLHFYFPYDQGYNQYEVVVKNSSGTQVLEPFTVSFVQDATNSTLLRADVGNTNQLNSLQRGGTYNFWGRPKYVTSQGSYLPGVYYNYISAEPSGQKTRIKEIPNNYMNTQWEYSINPFTVWSSNITFLDISEGRKDDWFLEYGFSEVPQFKVTATSPYDSSTLTLSKTFPFESYQGNTAKIVLTGSDVYSLFGSATLNLNKNSKTTYQVPVTISATSHFSEKIHGDVIKNVNFFTSLDIPSNNQEVYFDITKPVFLKETMPVYLNFNYNSYHGAPKSLKVAAMSNDDTELFSFTRKNVKWDSSTNTLGNNSPITYTINKDDGLLGNIPPIATDNTVTKFVVTITDIFNTQDSYTWTPTESFSLKSHSSGRLQVNKIFYNNEEKMIKFDFQIASFGLGANLANTTHSFFKIEVLAKNSAGNDLPSFTIKDSTEYWPPSNEELPIIGQDYEISGSFIAVKLKLTVESWYSKDDTEIQYPTLYTYETDEFIVYNSQPTVSYRPNQIGINYDPTANSDNDEDNSNIQAAALVVGAYSGKNKVVFKSANQELVIDLNNGQISSFIIDCGTWDKN